MATLAGWIGFNLFILILLVMDLLIFHKKSHDLKVKEALILSAFWMGLALAFNLGIFFVMGRQPALEFLTGYVVEKSLSIDNLFVFLMIFKVFKVPPKYQHGILFWGIIGALMMRACFILGGIALLRNFHWIIYVFGAFLAFTGLKMLFNHDREIHPDQHWVLRSLRRLLPVARDPIDGRFFIHRAGKMYVTTMFLVLLTVEFTDLIFALDSIPAVLAITRDAFIVYTSNVFAILGLRALYFALAGMMDLFKYLHVGLSAILVFVGVKMVLVEHVTISIGVSLSIILGILFIAIIASVLEQRKPRVTNRAF